MKPSAEITVWGIMLSIMGPIVSGVAWFIMMAASGRPTGFALILGIVGAAASLLGIILVLVGMVRALQKLDSL